ncbi:MAG TPA: PLP-dependent aminotransferase family protein, partial [Planctomycetaceae bacterium]|nr:PLP-dependent aminotransferase family protein [Planctomycetaceae bacterium]
MAEALAHPELISLAAGFVDQETLPVEITARAQQAAFANQDAARASLQYSNPQGLNELRDALLRQSCQWDDSGIPDQVSNENVVTTPGSNQLLYMLANILLDPGDIIICGSPTYFIF